LRNIATKLAQAGDDAGWAFAKAQGRALSFDNIMERNEALADLAHAQLNIGLFDIACSAAVAIENPGGRCRLLQKIVIKQVQKGQNVSGTLAKALSVPHRSKVEWERCGAFRQIAQTQARLVRDDSRPTFTEALCVTVNISDVIKRSEAMIEIAASQAKVGFFDEAISTATEVSSTSCRAMAFLAIAIAQTKAGQNAVTTFAAALKHAIADWTIEESIYALHALRNPNAISNVEQACIYFILEVAKEQVRMGYDTDETFSEAVREAKKLHKLWCVRALCLIAISQARLGKDYGPTLSDAYEEANYILDDNPAYEAIHNAEAQIEKMSSDMPGADTEFETKVVDEYNRELNEIKSAIAKLAGQNNGGVVLETYLSQASRSLETAWRSCGVVTNLYPNKSTEIANFLITFSRKLVT
jgi:hypothetical protein